MDKVLESIAIELPELKILSGNELNHEITHVWRSDKPLICKAICYPGKVEEVSTILKICHHHNQSVVVHGGLTNLVSSTHTCNEDLVISMKRMNRIIEVDPVSRSMTVEAGVILEEVLQKADENGMFFPVNYGAKGSAQIGGAVSTNAGGTRVIRYGMMKEQVLGMEVVLADGTVVSSLKKIIKDNSGLDWKYLMIGTEGVYGVITSVVLRLREKPLSRISVLMALDRYEEVYGTLKELDKGLGGLLSAFELMWDDTYRALTSPPSVYKPPLPQGYSLYVLAELLGGHHEKDLSLLEKVVEKCLNDGLIRDATFASSHDELNWFWGIREDVHPLLSYGKYHQTFDISIPVPSIGEVVEETKKAIKNIEGVAECFALGHVGDGNIHFIILKISDSQILTDDINDVVYSRIRELKGSVSAEHGIGIDKLRYLPLSRNEEEIMLMKKLKSLLDPGNILNRGKVIP